MNSTGRILRVPVSGAQIYEAVFCSDCYQIDLDFDGDG